MDLQIDMDEGDLVFVNRKCPVLTNEGDIVAQRIYIRLRTILSEWFLDKKYGVPYYSILGNKISKEKADQILQTEILSVEGVREIFEWESDLDRKREFSCSFKVYTTNSVVNEPISINTSKLMRGVG